MAQKVHLENRNSKPMCGHHAVAGFYKDMKDYVPVLTKEHGEVTCKTCLRLMEMLRVAGFQSNFNVQTGGSR